MDKIALGEVKQDLCKFKYDKFVILPAIRAKLKEAELLYGQPKGYNYDSVGGGTNDNKSIIEKQYERMCNIRDKFQDLYNSISEREYEIIKVLMSFSPKKETPAKALRMYFIDGKKVIRIAEALQYEDGYVYKLLDEGIEIYANIVKQEKKREKKTQLY